jgi:hypothetical protein
MLAAIDTVNLSIFAGPAGITVAEISSAASGEPPPSPRRQAMYPRS